jgi:flagellar basal body rod protein FlgG
MTIPAIINTARTLSFYNLAQGVTANNLANSLSDGYKADHLTAHSSSGMPHPVPVQSLDLRQADLRDTSRALDVGLQGPGFTVIGTPQGERLSRGGSFEISPKGILIDRHGDPVLGVDGPINVTGNKVEIQPDGTLNVDGQRAGQLRLETVADPSKLTKVGNGQFVASAPLIAAPDVGVHQGAVEESNVSSVLGMVDLINIQRAYASSIDALKVMDGVLSTTTDIGRV